MTDVAAVAGVSHQTVSRVLNNIGTVRPETRERVLQAIEELGYRRNEAARALVTRKSRLIGIITTSFVHFGPASTLLSVQNAARKRNFYVSVATLATFTEESLTEAVDFLQGQGVAGFVIVAPIAEIGLALERLDLALPTVAISSAWVPGGKSVVRVGVDQASGASQGVKHLIDRGDVRIDFVQGPANWFDSQQRRVGWEQALEAAGLPLGRLWDGDWTAASGYQVGQAILSAGLPDAVFCGNDQMALGMLRAFAEASVSVPGDVRVLGFDNEESAAFFYPSLTTTAQNFETLGATAIDKLISLIDGNEVESSSIRTRLIVRDSA